MNISLMSFFAVSCGFVGKMFIAYTAIMVSYRFWKEHRIDAEVFKAMRREQFYGIVGMVFLVLEYIFHLINFFGYGI